MDISWGEIGTEIFKFALESLAQDISNSIEYDKGYVEGKVDGKKEGYVEASNEYRDKLLKQADKFSKEKIKYGNQQAEYEKLLDEYDKEIDRLNNKYNRSEMENEYLRALLLKERKLVSYKIENLTEECRQSIFNKVEFHEEIENKSREPERKLTKIQNKFDNMDSLINHMISNRNSMKILLEDSLIMETYFGAEFSNDWRNIFYGLVNAAPKAVYAILARDALRAYWVGDFTEVDVYFKIKYELSSVVQILTILLGSGLRIIKRNTGYKWEVIETKARVMVLYISPGAYVKGIEEHKPLQAKDVNAKYLKLTGVQFSSSSDNHQLIYIEV